MNKAVEILKEELTENMVELLEKTPHFEEFVIYAMISYSDVKLKDAYDEIERLKIGIHGIYNLCDNDNKTHEHIWKVANELLNPNEPILTSEE